MDPEVLKAFASEVDAAAAALGSLDVGVAATTSADGLSGSSTQWAARQVGRHLGLSAQDIANDIAAMADAVRGAGDRYQVEDADLAGTFKHLF